MKANEVEIGAVYKVRVGQALCPVKVLQRWDAGTRPWWTGINICTGRRITIRSARRLRCLHPAYVHRCPRCEASLHPSVGLCHGCQARLTWDGGKPHVLSTPEEQESWQSGENDEPIL